MNGIDALKILMGNTGWATALIVLGLALFAFGMYTGVSLKMIFGDYKSRLSDCEQGLASQLTKGDLELTMVHFETKMQQMMMDHYVARPEYELRHKQLEKQVDDNARRLEAIYAPRNIYAPRDAS